MIAASTTAETMNATPVARNAAFNPLILYVTPKMTAKTRKMNAAYRIVKDMLYSPVKFISLDDSCAPLSNAYRIYQPGACENIGVPDLSYVYCLLELLAIVFFFQTM